MDAKALVKKESVGIKKMRCLTGLLVTLFVGSSFAIHLSGEEQKANAVAAADVIYNFIQDQARIAGEIETWPISKTQFFLYSLDPKGGLSSAVNTEQVFHGFTILGKAEVAIENDKSAILKSFVQGIRENHGSVANCFNPRHALRLIIGSSTNDFAICFECLKVTPYGFNYGREFLITTSQSAEFNDFVDKYHLKKAKKNGL